MVIPKACHDPCGGETCLEENLAGLHVSLEVKTYAQYEGEVHQHDEPVD
jgi:hypothetical protein